MGIKLVLCTMFALVMLGSCALMGLEEEDTTTTDTGGSSGGVGTNGTTETIRTVFPEKISIDLPSSIRNRSRSSRSSISNQLELTDLILRKYSEILWDEEKYLFSREFDISKGYLIDGNCVDKNELTPAWTLTEIEKALNILINFLNQIAYPKSEAVKLTSDWQYLIDSKWLPSDPIHPTLYKRIDDDIYRNIVMSSYDYMNNSSASFCNSGTKIDNVTTGDYVAWTKEDETERFAGMSAQIGRIKGVYFDKLIKSASFFYHDKSEEETISGVKTNWDRSFQKSGSFEECGNNCVIYKGSGFLDNNTMFEINGIIEDSTGGYSISHIFSNASSYFQEEYWNVNNVLLFKKDGLCIGYTLDNASHCITNNSNDNLSIFQGSEPTSTDWNNLLENIGKFRNLSHELDHSNLLGSDKIWLLFNNKQVASDGRIPWYQIDGIVSSDSHSNKVSTILRYPQSSGSKNYYAYEVSHLATGPVFGTSNSYLPPNSTTEYTTVTLNSQ